MTSQRKSGPSTSLDTSFSVQSPWVWRGFLFLALIAFGLCLALAQTGRVLFALAWAVIALGWFGFAMWLWRKHVRQDDEAWRTSRQKSGRRLT